MQVARSDELHQQATTYCAQLQEYNGRLQSDAQGAAERLKTLQVGALSQCWTAINRRLGWSTVADPTKAVW